MATAAVNGVELYYEDVGQGEPLVFCHEFAGDSRSWAPQVRFFARRYRTITFNARGYPPSTVPEDPAAYSEEASVEDVYGLIRHLGIERAHVCGLSMGGSVALKLGIAHPEACRSLVVAGAGYGSTEHEQFVRDAHTTAELFEREGAAAAAEIYARGPGRQRFLEKDPLGWAEFRDLLATHSAVGSAHTLRRVQARRRTIYEVGDQLPDMHVPTLVAVGDEDELCLEPGLFMKRRLPNAGLAIFPNTGHTLNLEEPDLFNRTVLDFLTLVEQGRWTPRGEVSTSLFPSEARR
jgi:pimeloyl-ACP methyl ester carboxylesterase